MGPSIFLDSEKINSKRESLNWKFNQINIIDDSVTPQIIQWLKDFFSFYEDLTLGVFISNKNIDVEKWAFYRAIGKPFLQTYGHDSFARDFVAQLTAKEFEYISDEIDVITLEIINEFYLIKLPKLEPISSSLTKGIGVILLNSTENKKNFEDLKKYIEDYYLKSFSDNSIVKETKSSIQKEPDWHPFSSDEARNFYLFIEKKHGTGNKTIFGAYWKFLSDEGIVDKKVKSIKKRFVEWINLRFAFTDDEKIEKLQTNSSETFRDSLLDNLVDYEEKNGQLHNFLDDRNKTRQRGKPSSK